MPYCRVALESNGSWRVWLGLRIASAGIAALLVCGLGLWPTASSAAEDDAPTAAELAQIRAAEAARIASIERVYGAVVAIYGNDRGGGGSGVLYDSAGLALTNHHVVAAAGVEGWAGLADGKLYRWKLIGTDPGGDVAIIQLHGQDSFPFAPLGDSNRVRVGDWAMAMGNPFVLAEDQRPTVTLGVVSGVERYQEGAGKNTLVYGNCIQVDSSINPGNSGGPLFNLRGEVIGINGRGSFMERGRVNVGLGYAISVNQVKHFLPDLLATKVAQHGTLDALFGNRGKEVICHTLNLDSPAAAAGLELGDKLLEFEGQPISSANQFTNIISTLPAEWPVHMVFEHERERRELRVRLIALPYDTTQPAEPETPPEPKKEAPQKPGEAPSQPEEKPGESKPKPALQPDENPADEKPAEAPPADKPENPNEKPAEKPAPDPGKQPPMPIRQPRPKLPLSEPGKIRDEALNMQNAKRLVERYRAGSGAGAIADSVKGFKLVDDVEQQGRKIGTQTIWLAVDGRFRVEIRTPEAEVHAYDGTTYWTSSAEGKVESTPPARARRAALVSQAGALAALFEKEPFAAYGKLILETADKAQGRLAYRLKTNDSEGDWHYFWLSVLGAGGQPEVTLLKSGADADNVGPNPSVVYADWREVHGVRLPHRRAFVEGLAEKTTLEFKTVSSEALDSLEDSLFKGAGDAK